MIEVGQLYVTHQELEAYEDVRAYKRFHLAPGSVIIVLEEPWVYTYDGRDKRIMSVLTSQGTVYVPAFLFDLTIAYVTLLA